MVSSTLIAISLTSLASAVSNANTHSVAETFPSGAAGAAASQHSTVSSESWVQPSVSLESSAMRVNEHGRKNHTSSAVTTVEPIETIPSYKSTFRGVGNKTVAGEGPTPAPTAHQPWPFSMFSENYVPAVASLRKSDVPEDVASSVAKHLIDGALSPTQYTELLKEGIDIFTMDGYFPNATSLYSFATNAEKAYEEIHTDLSYWSYVDYARSVATMFDTSKINAEASAAATNTKFQAEKKAQSSYYSKVVSSLSADPSGSAALETLQRVADAYHSDFYPSQHVSIIEKALMKLIGSF